MLLLHDWYTSTTLGRIHFNLSDHERPCQHLFLVRAWDCSRTKTARAGHPRHKSPNNATWMKDSLPKATQQIWDKKSEKNKDLTFEDVTSA